MSIDHHIRHINKYFRNSNCYEKHKENNVCSQVKQCPTCSVFYKVFISKDKKAVHICGNFYCKICNAYQPKTHKCYVKRLKPPRNGKRQSSDSALNEPEDMVSAENEMQESADEDIHGPWVPEQFNYIFYDVETAAVSCNISDSLHVPILIVAQLCCNLCVESPLTDSCMRCGERQMVFRGEKSLTRFCNWLFTPKFKGRTLFAHNGGSYDHLFCLRYMHQHLIYPKVIFKGSKLVFMEVPDYKIKFLDSLNYMKCKLSGLPAYVDLSAEIGPKGFFPYKALTREYYGYCGPKLPREYYRPGSMLHAERDEFIHWYDNLPSDYVFNFKKELEQYCIQDVNILRMACIRFRQLMIQTAGLCPFSRSPTIAGYSHLVYRTRFMPENTIGVIPSNNYVSRMNTSHKAIAFLEYESHRLGYVPIRHAGTAEGEKRLLGIAVDGYMSDPEERVYIFSGCFFHACKKCYPSHMDHPFHQGQKMCEVFQNYQQRLAPLKDNYNVIEIWEHEYDHMIKTNPEFSDFVSNLDLERHRFIKPRDALLGGRVEVIRTFYDCKANSSPSELHYRDAISLYPKVLRDSKMPKGHPTLYHITTDKIGDISEYFGLVRLKILPPNDLFLPLLPHKTKGGKLVFGLCRTCADNIQTEPCQHSDEQRSIVGTYTTEEVKACLPLGYKVIQIYHVWHYTESAQYDPSKNEHGAFSEFINTFNKMKMAASGFPDHVKTDLQKRAYVKTLESRDKIKLSVDEIKKSPGICNMSKLLMNSSWGRHAYDESNSKVLYFTKPHEFYEMLNSPKFELDNLEIVNDDMIRVTVKPNEDFQTPSGQGSVIYSVFTTSYGRLAIYDAMKRVNHNCCYVDTDGVIYIKRAESPVIPIGIALGCFKNELKDSSDCIEVYAGAGLKSYAFKTRKGMVECKLKGISLDYDASKQLNLKSLIQLVTQDKNMVTTVTYPSRIKRPRQNVTNIHNKTETKTFRFIFDKRVIRGSGYLTYPFGYRGPLISE